MDDAAIVGVREGGCDLTTEAKGGFERQPPARIASDSGCPSTYSMAMKTSPESSPTS